MFSIIFDMDGTLLDTQKICIPAQDWAGERQGFKNVGECIPDVLQFDAETKALLNAEFSDLAEAIPFFESLL